MNERQVNAFDEASVRSAIVLGGTGLVGSTLVKQLIQDPQYKKVSSLVRRKSSIESVKLSQAIIDFEDFDSYGEFIHGHVLFLCMGTTIKVAGSKDAQYRVDHDYQLRAAEVAKKNGVRSCVLISSLGAELTSPFFYPRMKAELEADIRSLGFERTLILRPSFLDGPREQKRSGEALALGVLRKLPSLKMFRRARPVHAEVVAGAMRSGLNVLPSGEHTWGPEEILLHGQTARSY